MNIFDEIQNRAIDYKQVLSECDISLKVENPHISVIVPVCGRTEFNKVLCDHFCKARQVYNQAVAPALSILPIRARPMVSLTIVEHSDQPAHKSLCADWVNYVWIPKKGKPFNKCLAHNIGALLTQGANWFLFHDVDIMVPEDFFVKVMLNISRGGYTDGSGHAFDAVQTFAKRRLQHCDQWLTDELIQRRITMNEIDAYSGHYHAAQPGAMGGSIFLTNELFFKTTFCAQTFTDYGLEDAFFWQCINLIGKMGCCDLPELELYHLFHYANRETKPSDWSFYNTFLSMPDEKKKEFIKLMASNLNKYRHETIKA